MSEIRTKLEELISQLSDEQVRYTYALLRKIFRSLL
jgi:hypothetical protein